jgi:hypothetical protein
MGPRKISQLDKAFDVQHRKCAGKPFSMDLYVGQDGLHMVLLLSKIHFVRVLFALHGFYTPVVRRDVLCYGIVCPSICPCVCPGIVYSFLDFFFGHLWTYRIAIWFIVFALKSSVPFRIPV